MNSVTYMIFNTTALSLNLCELPVSLCRALEASSFSWFKYLTYDNVDLFRFNYHLCITFGIEKEDIDLQDSKSVTLKFLYILKGLVHVFW